MKLIDKYIGFTDKLQDFALLLIRLILAYGFYQPAMMKLNNFDSIVKWFSSMNYPMPTLSAFMATATEISGFVLLFLGLFSRFISLPLMFVMLVAFTTVHLPNGWEASNNGVEITVYYFAMLFVLLTKGSGKFSLDFVIKRFFGSKS